MASILENLLAPYDFLNKPDLALGVIQYVFLEVIVSRILRIETARTMGGGFCGAFHLDTIPRGAVCFYGEPGGTKGIRFSNASSGRC